MHRSQMLPSERARARAARLDAAGVDNRDGGVTFFYSRAGNAPTADEQRARTQWNSGAENNVTDSYHTGSNLGRLLDD